jgi:undecaprenyl diphosphate synthase
MHLLEQYLIEERKTLADENVRLKVIGRRDGLHASVIPC